MKNFMTALGIVVATLVIVFTFGAIFDTGWTLNFGGSYIPRVVSIQYGHRSFPEENNQCGITDQEMVLYSDIFNHEPVHLSNIEYSTCTDHFYYKEIDFNDPNLSEKDKQSLLKEFRFLIKKSSE